MAKKNIESVWADVHTWMTDTTKSALKEAEDLTRRGRLKMDLTRLSQELKEKMANLGVKVYARYSKTPDAPIAVDDELRALLQEIAKLEAEVAKTQQEYQAGEKKS